MNKQEEQEIIKKVEQKVFEVVEGLINGGGEQPGLGPVLNRSMSMTDASETYWGSSGRGNSKAKSNIRVVASLGFIKVEKHGRNERVSLAQKGLDLFNARQAQLREAALKAIEIQAKWAEAADRDAGFDGGEFSGPASDQAADLEIKELEKEFPFTVYEIEREMQKIAHEGEEEMYEQIRNGSFEG